MFFNRNLIHIIINLLLTVKIIYNILVKYTFNINIKKQLNDNVLLYH